MRYPNRDELVRMGLAVFAVYLGIYYWGAISKGLMLLLAALAPVLVGGAIAYIANIPMRFFEEKLSWMGDRPHLAKLRRPLSLLAAIGIVVVLAAVLLRFIVPELMQSMRMMSHKVPVFAEAIRELFREFDLEAMVDEQLDQLGDWERIQVQVSNYLMSGAGGVMGSVLSGVSSVLSQAFELFLSLILALYILMSKERLGSQVTTLIETYLGPEVRKNFVYVTGVLDHSFHNFIVGRCFVSLLLGIMCFGGMLLFRFPYSMTISTVVGVTYVVPVVGGYVGAIIGALLIFSISPVKALGFIVFLLVLEQFEANVIFPKVIGSSIGLPAIWVLAAVAVGGGLGGVPFVLLSVPVAASIYQLIGDDMRLRNGWAPVADTAEATPVEAAATEPEQQEER
jgi:predicted PurR-regulated permease PerM